MTCEALNSLLDKLMDGELTEDERAAMEAHGAECPECAAQIRATLQMKALFEEMEPEADVPLQAQANWRNAVRAEAAKAKRRKLSRWIGSAAAAVVVLVGVGLAVNGSFSPKQPSAAAPMLAAEVDSVSERAAGEYDEAPEVGLIETDGEAALEADAGALYEAEEASEAEEVTYKAAEFAYEADAEYAVNDAAMDSAVEADGEMAVAAAEPMEAADMAAEAPLLTLGESAASEQKCAAVAQQPPACELSIEVQDVAETCGVISDLAEEFEGACDVQSVEGGSANVYVELYGHNAADFLKAVVKLDASGNAPELPDLADEGSLLVLLVVNPSK